MTETSVIVHADPDLLAQAVAARLIVALIDAQADRGEAGIVLTGGRIASAVYRAVRSLPARDAVDWSRVDVWWGDERFLPAGDPDRNETQAREALLDTLPLTPARVHPMPPSDGPDGNDPEAAAARYAARAGPGGPPGHGGAAALRRAAAGRRRGRPRGVGVPRAPGGLRDAAGAARCGAARSRRRCGSR